MDMIAYCGLDCEACAAYIAYMTDDQELREKTAREWGEEHGIEVNPDDVNCTGCKGTGTQISFCSDECPIRICALERKVITCGHCGDYPCDKLTFIHEPVPEARERLDNIRKG
jgi:hypothetical protein